MESNAFPGNDDVNYVYKSQTTNNTVNSMINSSI